MSLAHKQFAIELLYLFLATAFFAVVLLATTGPEAPGTTIFCLLFAPMTSMPLVPVIPPSGIETVYGAETGRQKPGSEPMTSIPQYSGCRM